MGFGFRITCGSLPCSHFGNTWTPVLPCHRHILRATPVTRRAALGQQTSAERSASMDTSDALSSAAAGMRLQADRLDVIALNLANASTTGYRERVWSAGSFGDRLGSAVTADSRQGAIRRTGVRTDLAL